MEQPARRRKDAPISPMEEENFPDSPQRRAADREMDEPSNLRPSADPIPRRRAPAREAEDEDG